MKSHLKFREIVLEILEKVGFKLIHNGASENQSTPDLYLSYNEKEAFCEIKAYTQKIANTDLIDQAIKNLDLSIKLNSSSIPLLIISSTVSSKYKDLIKKKHGVLIWDNLELLQLSFDHADLYFKLTSSLYKLFGESNSSNSYDYIGLNEKEDILPNFVKFVPKGNPHNINTPKQNLCEELRNIPSGNSHFNEFEKKCTEILKQLFKDDLSIWGEQETTNDGLNRFDLLCKISPSSNNFWQQLINDFRSRYLIFEYKNYSKKISQKEIYSTEKYLFTKALRSIAFIITKNGADRNATKAAVGALNESGKLIFILTVDDLCEMLNEQNKGNEPIQILENKLDKVLTGINR